MRDFRATIRAASLQLRLTALAAGLLIPAVLCMFLVLLAEVKESRARFEQQLLATARALSSSVDRQFSEAAAINETLASSVLIERGDWAAFRKRALGVQRGRAGWFILSDDTGRQLVNTRLSAGVEPSDGGPPTINARLAAASGRTRIGDLAIGRRLQRFLVGVDTPIAHAGRTYDLAYVFEPSAFMPLFAEQRLVNGRLVSLLDRNLRIVARSRSQNAVVGRRPSAASLPVLRRATEGLGSGVSIEHDVTIFAYTRSPTSGYTTSVAVPRRLLDATVQRSLARIGAASVVLLGLGLALSWLASRGITRRLRALVEDAERLGRGEGVPARPAGAAELQAIQDALSHASAELLARQQRHRLLVNELNHRVKNTLATVQALAGQSLGRASAGPSEIADFNARLLALAGVHDLLTASSWGMTDLNEVLERTAGPSKARFTLAGPRVFLAPQAAVALSMMAHELTTNSLKYGALSVGGGDVMAEWSVKGSILDLVWSERGGPAVSPPARQGFGTRLIARLAAQEFQGAATYDYRPEGLVFTARLTLPDAVDDIGTFG